MFVIVVMSVLGCTRNDPVLTGVPDAPLLQELPSAADQRAEDAPEQAVVSAEYLQPEGVLVDIRYLGGRRYSTNRDIIQAQLGDRVDVRELSKERGQEVRFSRGSIRVFNDTIYMFSFPFPQPLRRHEALAAVGLPTIVDRYISLDREFRIHHEWDFRRIQLSRTAPDSELIDAITAWSWLPGEHLQRR